MLLRPHRPSDATQKHGSRRTGIHQNEIAGFWLLKLSIPAISNASASEKQTPAQSLRGLFTDDLVVHALKRLEGIVPLSFLHPSWDRPQGWTFDTTFVAGEANSSGFEFLHEAYSATDGNYTGKVTVPVLWDIKTRAIVNNESIEIVKMLNEAFDPLGADDTIDLYPRQLRSQIDNLNTRIGEHLSKGVYAVGQAEDQAAYGSAMNRLFEFLDQMEELVGRDGRFLLANQPTLADVLIFTPLVRFDSVYNPLFRASRRRLVDYPGLAALTNRIYQLPGVAKTVRFDHILAHYYDGDWGVASRRGITPEAPAIDFRSMS